MCPRCGSGSFRKARADAVFALLKVYECRRCSQQYRRPWSVWLCLLLLLIGVAMMSWLAVRGVQMRLSTRMFQPIWPAVLAGMGAVVALVGLIKLIFARGIKPPARQDWRDRREPMPPAIPRVTTLGSVPPDPAVVVPPPTFEQREPASPRPAISQPPARPTTIVASAMSRAAAERSSGTIAGGMAVAAASPAVMAHGLLGNGPMPSETMLRVLRSGVVIPAHPLALNRHREIDERRMRALTRYYLAAGAGGVAVGVHTTQFAIRKPKFNLLKPVLEIVSGELKAHEERTGKTLVKVAGVCGPTRQAVAEAQLAVSLGYDAGLLNLGALPEQASEFELIDHCKQVAQVIPLFGFYLQPAVGGRLLPLSFWRAFVEISNVVAIKVATFNRYQTIDVMRAVAEAGRALKPGVDATNPIAIYTGNDDTIVGDLVGDWVYQVQGKPVAQRIVGGLLGHWACWTQAAVGTLERMKQVNQNGHVPAETAVLARQVTDMNAAIFDAANNFRGAIAGVNEVLHRQGLLEGNWCLEPQEDLSPGQAEEITRVIQAYPHLTDDLFVSEHLSEWLR